MYCMILKSRRNVNECYACGFFLLLRCACHLPYIQFLNTVCGSQHHYKPTEPNIDVIHFRFSVRCK